MSAPTLHDLILSRLATLGMDLPTFYRALGLRRQHKAQAMMDRIARDDMRHMVHQRRAIARVLDLPLAEIDAAIEISRHLQAARREAEWIAAFKPHAMLLTEHRRPQIGQITICALAGAPAKLYIALPATTPVVDWPRFVTERLPRGLPGFGLVTGFVINYAPDNAVVFDPQGQPCNTLDRAYRRGTTARISGISAEAIGLQT